MSESLKNTLTQKYRFRYEINLLSDFILTQPSQIRNTTNKIFLQKSQKLVDK